MKKYNLAFDITDKNLIFRLAGIGQRFLFDYPEILKLRDNYGNSILHRFVNSSSFDDDDIQFLFDKFPNIHKYRDNAGKTPLHSIGWRLRPELLKHPKMNSVYCDKNQTPYMELLARAPAAILKHCLVLEELLKPLPGEEELVLKTLSDRSKGITTGQLKKIGLPLSGSPRKIFGYEQYKDFMGSKSLRYIIEP